MFSDETGLQPCIRIAVYIGFPEADGIGYPAVGDCADAYAEAVGEAGIDVELRRECTNCRVWRPSAHRPSRPKGRSVSFSCVDARERGADGGHQSRYSLKKR